MSTVVSSFGFHSFAYTASLLILCLSGDKLHVVLGVSTPGGYRQEEAKRAHILSSFTTFYLGLADDH